MKQFTIFLTFLLLVAAFAIAAVNAEPASQTIVDMAGRSVEVPQNPNRIVGLGPGALRLIVYLQAAEKVVGIEDMETRNPGGRPYWLAHPELAELPSVGPGGPASINKKPDLESVLAAKPDLLFITYMDAERADEVQRLLQIPVVVLSYGTFATFDETVYDALRLVGKILDRKQRAEKVISFIEHHRADLKKRTASTPAEQKPSVYVGGLGYRGAHGIQSTKNQYTPFLWTSANNVAATMEASVDSHVFVSKEQLLVFNPDIIFLDGTGLALIRQDYRKNTEYYQALKAFKNKRVYTLLPYNFYTTNIGTALADAYAVGKILAPQFFEDIDPEKMADTIYTELVGAPVYKQMKKDFSGIGKKPTFLISENH